MFTKIKLNYDGKIVESILLATFDCKREWYERKHFLWLKKDKKYSFHDYIKKCLVYIPWKNQPKVLQILPIEFCLDEPVFTDLSNINNYVNGFEIQNDTSKKYIKTYIKNIQGYSFVANKDFLNDFELLNNVDKCLNNLYNEMPEIYDEEVDDTNILNNVFQIVTENKLQGAFIEFQYCDKEKMKKPFKKIDFKKIGSLAISPNNLSEFENLYAEHLEHCISPDGTGRFYEFGLNYYTKDMAKEVFEKIKSANIVGSQILLDWLEKSFTEHNGFYILGL